MGSVIDFIECPNCKHEATEDYYYRTGECYTFCRNCGYSHTERIKNRDKKLNELKEEDWDIVTVDKPYGAYIIEMKDSPSNLIGTLINEEHFNEICNNVHAFIGEVKSFQINQFIDGEVRNTLILDSEK